MSKSLDTIYGKIIGTNPDNPYEVYKDISTMDVESNDRQNRRDKYNKIKADIFSQKQILMEAQDLEEDALHHWCSGELFDLTATSYNNKYGREKILYSIMYGISLPIQKYLDEFETMEQDEQALGEPPNDKAGKRTIRKQFLELCNSDKDLQLFFRKMCNYLNGGDGTVEYQYGQPLTIICAGGNLITIFFKLLQNIIQHIEYRTPLDSLNANPNFTVLVQTIIKKINDSNKVLNDDPPLTQFIKRFTGQEPFITFSDFDYNLVPFDHARSFFNDIEDPMLMLEQLEHERQKELEDALNIKMLTIFETMGINLNDIDGFILFRIKTRLKSVMEKAYQKLKPVEFEKCKRACATNISPITGRNYPLKALYAQRVNRSELQHITDPTCLQYYTYLLKKKEYIQKATKMNVNQTIQYWKRYLKKNRMSDLNSIVEYLHATTSTLNYDIQFRCNNRDLSINYFALFASLRTMLGNDLLVDESASILLDFMTTGVDRNLQLHTKEIVQSIHSNGAERRGACGTPIVDPSTSNAKDPYLHEDPFIRAVSQPNLGTLMDNIKKLPPFFKELNNDDEWYKLPNDISIIFNAIETSGKDDPDAVNDSPDSSPIIVKPKDAKMSFGGKRTKTLKSRTKTLKSKTKKNKSRTKTLKSRTNKKKSRKI